MLPLCGQAKQFKLRASPAYVQETKPGSEEVGQQFIGIGQRGGSSLVGVTWVQGQWSIAAKEA